MAELISVYPQDIDEDAAGDIVIQWNMGNSCNYECDYCPGILHDGSRPWIAVEKITSAISKIVAYYAEKNMKVHWQLIGGEVTVMPNFQKVLQTINDSGSTCSIYTNGSRTISWWKKNKHLIQDIVLTFHPNTQSKEHFLELVQELKDTNSMIIHLAAVQGKMEELLELRNTVVSMIDDFEQCIHIKRLYKKTFSSYKSQDSFYDYTEREEEILNMLFEKETETLPASSMEEEPEMEIVEEPKLVYEYDDGSKEFIEIRQVKNLKRNKYKGLNCYLGANMLSIDFKGDIWGSWCGIRKIGNVSDLDGVDFSPMPVICSFEFCNNQNDIIIPKYR